MQLYVLLLWVNIVQGTTKKWVRCNRDLRYGSELVNSIEYYHNISTKGYRSLIFNGDLDIVVPHISTEAWIRTFTNLSITNDWQPWFVSEQVAGEPAIQLQNTNQQNVIPCLRGGFQILHCERIISTRPLGWITGAEEAEVYTSLEG